MGFMKGFLLAIPVGLYFGEKGLDFPLAYYHRRNSWGSLRLDFIFIDFLVLDIQHLFGSMNS